MNTNYNKSQLKVLDPKSAKLVRELYSQNIKFFGLKEILKITGLTTTSAHKLISRMIHRGVLNRLKSGFYNLVPFELGEERFYFGNPYIIAREFVKKTAKKSASDDYYISHGSAMQIHQMVTQPQLIIYASVRNRILPQNIMGTDFHFVLCKKNHLFGYNNFWIEKSEKIFVSDIEKTILDGLKMPQYCGGIIEVAKAMWIKRNDLNIDKILNYARRLNVGAVYRRLGFLLEVFAINHRGVESLRKKISNTYQLLDPTLPKEGKHNSKWRLQINVSKDELTEITRT